VARAAPAPPAPRPAPPPQDDKLDKAALERFSLDLQRRLGALVNQRGDRAYPRLAKQAGWEGITEVSVEFAAKGQIKGIKIRTSSGYALLDARALELVRELPMKVPRELIAHRFTVNLPVSFVLKRETVDVQ
jgi:TonB family protein